MRAIIAALIAVAILWVADTELNDGRYTTVISRAVMSVVGR